MSKNPYIPFYPSDWLAGTRGLSAAETGVYITLISMMYEREAPLDFDHKRLARLCGTTSQTFKASLSVLIEEEKIIETDAGLWNERVDAELEKRSEKSHRNSESAKVRWKKDKQKQRRTDANAMPTQCERNANQNQNHIPPYNPPKGEVEKLRDQMWEEWPQESRKRTSKSKFLEKLSLALKRDEMTCDEMLGAFRHWLSEQSREDGGKFVPNPERFFNAKFHLDHKGKTAPATGNGGMSPTTKDYLERKQKREQARQQEGSAQPEHLFLAAGGMR